MSAKTNYILSQNGNSKMVDNILAKEKVTVCPVVSGDQNGISH